jgi:phage-related minor tail protein
MATEVGVGYVRLIPSMKGFSSAASRGMTGALKGPSTAAGKDAGGSFVGGFGSGVDRNKGRFASLGEKAGGFLKGALVAGGIAAGAAAAAAVVQGFETEAAGAKLEAQLGGGEWAEGAGEVAGDLYTSGFGDSVADTAATVKAVFQGGLFPDDVGQAELRDMSERAATFADVLDQDVQGAVNAVGQMIRTGLVSDATAGFDVLTAGIQGGADKAGDLLDTFNEYGTMFRDVGLNGSQAMGLTPQGLGAGARDADKVADALKEFAIRAQDGSEASAAGFEAIGLNAEQMTAKVAAGGPKAREALGQVLDGLRGIEDPAKRNAAAVALFGTQAEDMGDALFALDLDTAAQGLGDVAGRTDDLGSAYDTNSQKIETFRRQAMEKLTNFIGTSVLPKLESLGQWVSDNPGKFQALAAVIGGALVAAFGLWAVSAAAAAIPTIAATWPVILLGAAVAGLAYLVISHWDTIKGAFSKGVELIRTAIGGVINWIKTNWPKILAVLTGPIGLAVLFITSHWDKIKRGITAVKDWIVARFNDVKSFVTGLPGKHANAGAGMWDFIKNTFKSAINAVIGLWNNFSIPSFTIGGWDTPGPLPDVPSFTTPEINTPNIPLLARGGILTGPGLFGGGEAGDEAVLPLDRLQPMIDHALIAAAGSRPAATAPVEIKFAVAGSGLFEDALHHAVRVGRIQLYADGSRVSVDRGR